MQVLLARRGLALRCGCLHWTVLIILILLNKWQTPQKPLNLWYSRIFCNTVIVTSNCRMRMWKLLIIICFVLAIKIIFWAVIRCSNVNCMSTMHKSSRIIQKRKIHTQNYNFSVSLLNKKIYQLWEKETSLDTGHMKLEFYLQNRKEVHKIKRNK